MITRRMEWLKPIREAPLWYITAVAGVFIAFLYFGIIAPYMKIAAGEPLQWGVNAYNMRYLSGWIFPVTHERSILRFAAPFICLLLGFVCLLLGIARSSNKLGGNASYLLAVFLVLFFLSEMTQIDSIVESSLGYAVILIDRIASFLYPIPIYIFFFSLLRPQIQKWAWPLYAVLATYCTAAWLAYLTVGLPAATSLLLYTDVNILCFVLFLILGIFGAATKSSLFLMRLISVYGCVFIAIIVGMSMLGSDFNRHDTYVIGMTIMAAISVSYLVFTSSNELFMYKAGLHMQKERNVLLIENYQSLEDYMRQISQMKHEMRNHLLAMRILSDDKQYERLATYIDDIQSNYPEHIEPIQCGHHLIQSILGHFKLRAQQANTEINLSISPLPPLSITDADAVSLLMNLLNNALESCEKIQPPDKRWIEILIKCSDPYLYISVKNAMRGAIRHKNGGYVTTKEHAKFHGHGISIVSAIAEKCGGFASFEHSDDSFNAEVALCVIAGKTAAMMQD